MKTPIKNRFCILEFNAGRTVRLARYFADTFHKAMKKIRVQAKAAPASRFDVYDHSLCALVKRI